MPFLACLPLIEADLPAVLDLDQRCLGGLWTHSGYMRELESDCSDLLVLVSAPNTEVLLPQRIHRDSTTLLGIGCLWAILEEAHITTLAIEPAQQGQKLGQFLLTELLLHGYRRGLERATLEVRESNKRALKLYQKFEFKEAGLRKRYYSDGENARILWHSPLQSDQTLARINRYQTQSMTHLKSRYKDVFVS